MFSWSALFASKNEILRISEFALLAYRVFNISLVTFRDNILQSILWYFQCNNLLLKKRQYIELFVICSFKSKAKNRYSERLDYGILAFLKL